MTQQPPQGWPPWAALCHAHTEDIGELRTQTTLLQRDLAEIKELVVDGLQADVREIKGLVHDIKAALRYSMLFLRVAALGIPALGTMYAAFKFAGLI